LGNPQTLNLYTYVGNNPLSIVDLYGHGWFKDFLNGFADATYRPLVQVVRHPIITGKAIGIAVTHPVATYHAIKGGVVTTTQQVLTGNGKAIGTALGTVGILAVPGVGEAGDAIEAVDGVAEAGEAAEAAESVSAIGNANKLEHIFGNAEHSLDSLVSEFGSREAAGNAIQQAAEGAVRQQGLTGVFETSVKVGNQSITVRGIVIDGAVKIGTAFK
jgi:hypothetical protein